MNKRESSNISWLFSQVGDRKGRLIASIFLAICDVICGVIPFLVASKIMSHLLAGSKDENQYFMLFGIMTLGFTGKAGLQVSLKISWQNVLMPWKQL